ncbi:MAG: GTPase [Phycisphaerae bacterium]
MSGAAGDAVRCAVLTGAAPGAIGVIGVFGTGAAALLGGLLRSADGAAWGAWTDSAVRRCRVMDGAALLDEGLALTWDAGRCAELHLHGGVRIVERVIELLEARGALRAAGPEADAACDWIEAEIDVLLRGATTRRMARWLLAQRRLLPELIRRGAGDASCAALAHRAAVAERLLAGLRVAIVGPPNAGKSTLANRLIGHERVVTSAEPGTTRDWVDELASVSGWPVTLTDTAGVRVATDAIERESIARGLAEARRADAALVVLDGAAGVAQTAADLAAVSGALPAALARVVVVNKCDLASAARDDWAARLAAAAGGVAAVARVWPVSALCGDGVDALEAALAVALRLDGLADDAPTPLTARQRAALGVAPA